MSAELLSARKVMLASWKLVAGATAVTSGALAIPPVYEVPSAILWIGVAMIVGGLIAGLVFFLDSSSYEDASERFGHLLGAGVIVLFGAFLAGAISFLPSPQAVSSRIESQVVHISTGAPARSGATANGVERHLRVRIDAQPQAESFAAALRRELPRAVGRVGVAGDRRTIEVAGTASGQWADAAARLYVGRLDVALRVQGTEAVCELRLTSSGRQTVENAAIQVSEQVAERIISLMQGDEEC